MLEVAVSALALLAPNDHKLDSCVIYDTRSNIAVWTTVTGDGTVRNRRRETIHVSKFIDRGAESIFHGPPRVAAVITNWPIVPHIGFRVRCEVPEFTHLATRAIKTCGSRPNAVRRFIERIWF